VQFLIEEFKMKQYITGFITAICLTTSVFMFVGAQNTNLGDIEVTSLRIMGDNGSEILLIGRGIVMSKNKKPMVTLFCEDIGGFISTFNADFKETTYLGTNAGGDGHIETFNADGKTTAFLGTGGSGGGHIRTSNADGKETAVFGTDKDGAGQLRTYNEDGKETAYLGTNASGSGRISTFNADDKAIVIIGTDENGGGHIETLNKHGELVGYFGTADDGDNFIQDGIILLYDRYGELGWTEDGKQ
jgi:hypothetical protein